MAKTLRRQTRAAHHTLDHHPLLQRLVLPGLTWHAYAQSLLALYRPHAALEACVAEAAARFGLVDGDAVPSPSRLALLEVDLSVLQQHLPGLRLACLADGEVDGWPRADTPAALVGQRYVLDGSRLGGQLVARQVTERLGPQAPQRFFMADDPGWHWQRFLGFAERHCPPGEIDHAVEAAQLAFANFLAHLDMRS